MKKIALITTNKILAESLDSAMKSMPNSKLELVLLLNSHQALLDAEIHEIEVALIDMGTINVMDKARVEGDRSLSFCERLNKSLPNCQILLLVSGDDLVNRELATKAKKKKIIHDFVFYDASLKYLLAKLNAL